MDEQGGRQVYRFRGSRNGRAAPEWLRKGGLYEGDLAPASQGAPGEGVRLVSPEDPDSCCMVGRDDVEEV